MRSVEEGQKAQAVPAHFYRDAPRGAHQRRRHAAVLDMVSGLHGSMLDVGCGYGDLAWAMSKVLGPVQGVDVDAGRVAFASEQYAPIPFSVCRADRLDFADASFDNVASLVVLPFVPDVDTHMSELYRVLKPGGHVVLGTRASSWLSTLRLRLRLGGSGQRSALHLHSMAAAQQLLEGHGFERVRSGALYDPPFANRRNLGDWINSSVEYVGASLGIARLAPYPLLLARRQSFSRA